MRAVAALLRATRPALIAIAALTALATAAGVRGLVHALHAPLDAIAVGLLALAPLLLAPLARRRGLTVVKAIGLAQALRRSAPRRHRTVLVPGLDGQATVEYGRHGIPTIAAGTRRDAMCALGWVTARDRLFQMDLRRREISGRLSEILGPATLESDIASRAIGFDRVCDEILARLPDGQRAALDGYTAGVNAYLRSMQAPPFEYQVLSCPPEPWTDADSVLCVLGMFRALCGDESAERMLTVMRRTLPEDVVAFLAPGRDRYDELLEGAEARADAAEAVPVASLVAVLERGRAAADAMRSLVRAGDEVSGSNAWAVDATRTADGRAMLANDLHLGLTLPNSWYAAQITYDDARQARKMRLVGVIAPGVPLVVAGENGDVAWGCTNLAADCLDLVELELHPTNPDLYRTPDGWRQVESASETIAVRGSTPHVEVVRTTIWGPISQKRLSGKEVAVRWTAHDPAAVDFGLIDMDRATTVAEAVEVVGSFAGPPLNVVVADRAGAVASAACGKLPLRRGFDGAAAVSWADGDVGWFGYVEPRSLPRHVAPACGFVVSANNRPLGTACPHVIGHNFASGYRARRIAEMLGNATALTETDLVRMQLDTTAEPYDFYRRLILELVPDDAGGSLSGIASIMRDWDGRAGVHSAAFALLARFRERLAEAVLSAFLAPCGDADADFVYSWGKCDAPLRALLTERRPELLPYPGRFDDWESLLVAILEGCAQSLLDETGARALSKLRWGSVNRVQIRHLLARSVPGLGRLLEMPRDPLPGCPNCVRVASPGFGATMRMVVSAGHGEDVRMQMPCGQSGHPLSAQFGDLQRRWVQGEPVSLRPGRTRLAVVLTLDREAEVARAG